MKNLLKSFYFGDNKRQILLFPKCREMWGNAEKCGEMPIQIRELK